MGCLVFCGLMLLAGAKASGPWMAVAAISLSVACLFSTEGPYWSTIIRLAGPHAGAAGGLMNMLGNLGGAVSTAAGAVPGALLRLVRGAGLRIGLRHFAAAFWLLIRSDSKTPALTLGGVEHAAEKRNESSNQ